MEYRGLIVKSLGGFYEVQIDSVDLYPVNRMICKAKGVFRKQKIVPRVGDYVTVSQTGKDLGTLKEIYPRKNELVRPLLANLDQVFVVVSLADPMPNLEMVDKLLALCQYKDIHPVVIFTKQDLKDGTHLKQLYQRAGISSILMTNDSTEPLNCIRKMMCEKISAFIGNSGVGKSSLLNRLNSDLNLKTGEISQKLGRGKHTTREVALYYLEDVKGYIADTPGFGTVDLFRYEQIEQDALAYCFIEFSAYAQSCQFTGCSHTVEQGCAILYAVEQHQIARCRHQNYCKMYAEIQEKRRWT